MKQGHYLSIGEFSRLTGIRTDNLRFYNRIGLLSPEARGANGYRYYTRRQLDLAFLIVDLRTLGVGLEEIRRYASERSPGRMQELFGQQNAHIEAEIQRLKSIQDLMALRMRMAAAAVQCERKTLQLEERKREPIFLVPPAAAPGIQNEDDELLWAYEYAGTQGVNTSFPFGAAIYWKTQEQGGRLEETLWQYYFKVDRKQNSWKPAGTYAVYQDALAEGASDEMYRDFLTAIKGAGLEISGPIYEECPLDELCTAAGEPYTLRLEVMVNSGNC